MCLISCYVLGFSLGNLHPSTLWMWRLGRTAVQEGYQTWNCFVLLGGFNAHMGNGTNAQRGMMERNQNRVWILDIRNVFWPSVVCPGHLGEWRGGAFTTSCFRVQGLLCQSEQQSTNPVVVVKSKSYVSLLVWKHLGVPWQDGRNPLWRRWSEVLHMDCCPSNPTLDKWKKMDGRYFFCVMNCTFYTILLLRVG